MADDVLEPVERVAGTVNAKLGSSMAALGGEWLDFMNRRWREELALGPRIAAANGPGELWQAYSDFWVRTFDDYQREVPELSRLYFRATTAAPMALGDCARHMNGPHDGHGNGHHAARRRKS